MRDVERRHHRDTLGAHHFSRLADLVHLGVEIGDRLHQRLAFVIVAGYAVDSSQQVDFDGLRVLGHARASAGQAGEKTFQSGPRAVDFLVQVRGVVAASGELLPQLGVLRAQLLAQRDELRDLLFQRVELRLHTTTMFQISSYVKQVGRVLHVIHYLVLLAPSRMKHSRLAPSRMRGVWRSMRAAGSRWRCLVTGEAFQSYKAMAAPPTMPAGLARSTASRSIWGAIPGKPANTFSPPHRRITLLMT